MRIVFLGNFEVDYSSETHHAKTLESMGHEVVRFQEQSAYAENVLTESIRSDMFVYVHTHNWQIPTNTGLTLTDILRTLKGLNIPTVTYHLDLWKGIAREKDLEDDDFYKNIEYFFATDKLMCDWFNAETNVKGVYLPAGVFGEETGYISRSSNYANDVVFVGSKGYHPEWNYRPELIDWLRATYGERFTHVGGDGDTGTIRGWELNALYANSKVAIGDTLCIGYDYPYYFSDRLFESTGRGGFTIFPYIKGIEDCFEIDKEIVVYNFGDFDQLRSKIDYYLEHDDEREAIRRAGHERTKKDHTYTNRWQFILDTVTKGKK